MITNASREGARAGIVFVDPRINADIDVGITSVVSSYCASHLISFDPGGSTLSIGISRSGTGIAAGDSLTVTVTYPFQFLVFSNVLALIGGNVGNSIALSAVTVMRLE
jgi:hypothetical protein